MPERPFKDGIYNPATAVSSHECQAYYRADTLVPSNWERLAALSRGAPLFYRGRYQVALTLYLR